jgi:hypothetical protein
MTQQEVLEERFLLACMGEDKSALDWQGRLQNRPCCRHHLKDRGYEDIHEKVVPTEIHRRSDYTPSTIVALGGFARRSVILALRKRFCLRQ